MCDRTIYDFEHFVDRKMYHFLVILKFLNGSSLYSILDKLNLFSVRLAHFEVFICRVSIHCLISDWFNIQYW